MVVGPGKQPELLYSRHTEGSAQYTEEVALMLAR
jgi:hypothetical protein